MPGKKDKKKKQEVEPEPVKPEDAEYDRDSLKVKISTYEMKIMRLHRENLELEAKAEKAHREMKDSTTQSLEMFQRLTDKMDAKDRDISRMRGDMATAEDEKARMEADLRNQIAAEKDEREAMRDRFVQEAAVLQQKLDEVTQFRQQKDSMTKKVCVPRVASGPARATSCRSSNWRMRWRKTRQSTRQNWTGCTRHTSRTAKSCAATSSASGARHASRCTS